MFIKYLITADMPVKLGRYVEIEFFSISELNTLSFGVAVTNFVII